MQCMLKCLSQIVISKPVAFPALKSVGYCSYLGWRDEEDVFTPWTHEVKEAYDMGIVKLYSYERD